MQHISVKFSVANKSRSSQHMVMNILLFTTKTDLYLVHLAMVLQNHVHHFFNIVCPTMYHDIHYISTQHWCQCRSQWLCGL